MATKSLVYVILGKDQLTPVMRKAATEASTSGSKIGTSFKAAGMAVAAMGSAAVVGLGAAVNAARNMNLVPLQQAAKNAGIAWKAFGPQVLVADTALAKLGFTGGQTNQALTKLVTATGDSKASLAALATTADYARFKGISLTDAATALSRAASGNTRALRDLGISSADLPKKFATTGTEASRLGTVIGLMSAKIGGQAVAYTQTFGGKLDVLKAQVSNSAAQIGTALLPALSSLIGTMTRVVVPIMQQKSAFATLAIGITAFAATAKVAMTLFATSTKAALVGSVVGIAILALTVAITELLLHWNTVWNALRRVTQVVCNAITGAAKAVWSWLRANWPYLLGILTGPIGMATVLIIKNWDNIKRACSAAFGAVVGFFRAMPGRILGAVGNLGSLLYNGGKNIITGLFNGLKAIWNTVIGWFKGIPSAILHALGIASPPKWSISAGKFIMQGITKGLKGGWNAVTGFFGSLAGAASGMLGSGMSGISLGTSWQNALKAALVIDNAPASWLPALETLVMKESGGNATAVNPISVLGQHATGLMQMLPSTFAAYMLKGFGNIFNAVDNAVAAIRYIKAIYGSPYSINGLFGGNYVGYALGTASARRGWAWVGEGGQPELVHFNGGEQVGPVVGGGRGGSVINHNVTVNVGNVLASKQEIGRTVCDALREFEHKGGRVPYVSK